jgi:hypothetical protein
MSLVVHRYGTIGHSSSSSFMYNQAQTPLSRRRLLHAAMFAGAMAAAGCGESGGVQQVTTPPTEGANRDRLKKQEKTTEDLKNNPPKNRRR